MPRELLFAAVLLLGTLFISSTIGAIPTSFNTGSASTIMKIDPSALAAIANDDPTSVGYIWGIADPHVDLLYKENTNPNCGIPQCCRVQQPNGTNDSGKFGAFGHCDSMYLMTRGRMEFLLKIFFANSSARDLPRYA